MTEKRRAAIRANVKAWRKKPGNAEKARRYARESARRQREKNPGPWREANWRQHGIELTWERYNELIVEQQNACGICRRLFDKTPRVDHDHETGVVRGLLCHSCNTALGHLHDDPALLIAAAAWVSRGKE